jgi:hypothetical protein
MVAYTYRRQTIKVVLLAEEWIKNGPRSQGIYPGTVASDTAGR